jgi:hypothetical protein
MAWHIYFAAAAVLLLRGMVSVRAIGIMLGLPFLSVTAMAWRIGNPFNGTMFLVSAAALFALDANA